MFVLSVSIQVKPEHVEEFIPAMLANARGSRTEPGNLRFDVMRDVDDPNHFLLHEVYTDAAALEAHRETPHFKTWAATVEPWLAQARTRVRSQLLFYGDAEV
ncbi:MAG TPA: putative quinol monooxygenase [Roseiflexaceae bacterium]|nr:putative quinol monooxygenase [Roseiflexaceae bacterium]